MLGIMNSVIRTATFNDDFQAKSSKKPRKHYREVRLPNQIAHDDAQYELLRHMSAWVSL